MNYEENIIPRGVFADMYGPPKPVFYELLLPLITRLFSPHDLEMNQEWLKLDGAKSALVEELLRRVDLLSAEIETQKNLVIERDATIDRLNRDIKYLKADCKEQHELFCEVYQENKDFQVQLERMEAEIQMCRKHPIVVERKVDEGVVLPQTVWMTEWRSKAGFEKQAAILRIMGETGVGRMPDIKKKAAREFGYSSPSAGGISKAIAALKKRGLLAIRQADNGMQGRPPKLGWLTDLGQAAYVLLTNKPPVRSELDTQSSHVSDAHMLLNLEASDLLEAAGYQILEHGHRHFLDGVRQAVPDLTTSKDGEIIYIEVERSGKKSSRPEKWVNLCELTCGQIYVFCQYPDSQDEISLEIQKALVEHNLSACLTMTNLADLRYGIRGPGRSLWLAQIDIYPGMQFRESTFFD